MTATAATRRRRARDQAVPAAPAEPVQSDAGRGSFTRLPSHLWIDPEFRLLSHAAAGLYTRLYSFLDDQENTRPTGWKVTVGDSGAVGMFAGESVPAPLLDELVEAHQATDLGHGCYRLENVEATTFEERQATKARWRTEKSRQRRTQVSGADTAPDSGPESEEESGGDS